LGLWLRWRRRVWRVILRHADFLFTDSPSAALNSDLFLIIVVEMIAQR
jgi:hypothetical protein